MIRALHVEMASKDQELNDLILQTLEQKGKLDSYDFSKLTSREHQTIVGAIKSLQSVGNVSTPCIRLPPSTHSHHCTLCR